MANLNSEITISIDPAVRPIFEEFAKQKMNDANGRPFTPLAIDPENYYNYLRMDANKAVYAVLTEDGVAAVANACAQKITERTTFNSLLPFDKLQEAFFAWHGKEDDNRWEIANNFMELAADMDLYQGTKEEYRAYLRERLQKIGDAFMAAWNEKNGTG